MNNGTVKPIKPHDWVSVRINPGKGTKYDGKDYFAGDTLVMRKYEADAHATAGIVTLVGPVEGYDPAHIEPVELHVAPPPAED